MKKTELFFYTQSFYECNVIPFGLANATGIFQEFISVVLQNIEDCISIYG